MSSVPRKKTGKQASPKKKIPAAKKHRGWNGGRKPSVNEPADKVIHVRVTKTRKNAYEAKAQAEGMKSLTAWVVAHLDEVAEFSDDDSRA